jgi:hypothetical protein
MTKLITSTLITLLLCLSANLHAELYYWKKADGSLMATDQPPPAGTPFRTADDLRAVNNWQQHGENTADEKDTAADNAAENDSDQNELAIVKLSPNAAPQEIKSAAATMKADNTNAHKAKPDTKTQIPAKESSLGSVTQTTAKNSAQKVTAETLQPNDEAGCQKLYGTNCDKVFNWREHGNKYCESFKNEKCSNEKWFENRFKPLTLEERHQRTLRNAARKNREAQEIRDYLHRKYIGICASDPDKAPRLCKNAVYDAKIQASFRKLSGNDQAEIRRLQEVLKTSKDRSLIDRTIEQLLSFLPLAAASQGL